MAGFFDWLLTDPTGADNGYLARLLGITPQGRGSATEGESLLGGSPLGNALRGGLAGVGSAAGRQGFGAQMAAGMMGASQLDQQRRQWAFQNAMDRLKLDRSAATHGTRIPERPSVPVAPTGTATAQNAMGLGQEHMNQLLSAAQRAAPVGSGRDAGSPHGEPVGAAISSTDGGGARTVMVKDAAGTLRPLDDQNEVVLLGQDGMPMVYRRGEKTDLSGPNAIAQILSFWTPEAGSGN